jgi:hypothetical protein
MPTSPSSSPPTLVAIAIARPPPLSLSPLPCCPRPLRHAPLSSPSASPSPSPLCRTPPQSPSSSPSLLSPLPSLLSLACHPRRHRHRSLRRPPPFSPSPSPSTPPFVTRPPSASHLMLIVVSSLSPLPLPPSPWPSSLLVACRSRRTCHRQRPLCDRARSPCSAMMPPAMRRVLTKDIRRLRGWLSPRRCALPPALSTLGTTINARRCA